MQDIEPKDKISLPRVKWLETPLGQIKLALTEDNILIKSRDGYAKLSRHASDCARHNEPAYPNGLCNCNLIIEIKHLSLLDRLKRMFKR